MGAKINVLGLIMSISPYRRTAIVSEVLKKAYFGHNFFHFIILLKNVELWIRVEGGSDNVNRDSILFLWDL